MHIAAIDRLANSLPERVSESSLSPRLRDSEYDTAMTEAVVHHVNEDYEDALSGAFKAFVFSDGDMLERGRAARDISARFDRLGRYALAARFAEEAHQIHRDASRASEEIPTRQMHREHGASFLYVGVSALRKAFDEKPERPESSDSPALNAMRRAWYKIRLSKQQAKGINRFVDQYEINAARRVSMAESLLGDRKRGLAIGAKAVALSCLSESPLLDTANPNLSKEQRKQAKVKALKGGLAALAINALANPKRSPARWAAWKLAKKTL